MERLHANNGLNPESEFYLNGHKVKDRWGLTPKKFFINMSQPSTRPKGGVCDFWGCRVGGGGQRELEGT